MLKLPNLLPPVPFICDSSRTWIWSPSARPTPRKFVTWMSTRAAKKGKPGRNEKGGVMVQLWIGATSEVQKKYLC